MSKKFRPIVPPPAAARHAVAGRSAAAMTVTAATDAAPAVDDQTTTAGGDASIPTLEHSHKDPAQRAHVWERPARVDEREPVADPHADYEHALPRWVHKDGEQKFVSTPAECDAARRDGWLIDPNDEAK